MLHSLLLNRLSYKTAFWISQVTVLLLSTSAQTTPRARDLGIPFEGKPGKLDAITDVVGIEIGHTTLISGNGKLQRGIGPIRTGVTAILPRGRNDSTPVFASSFSQNGNGEMTGVAWVEESGFAEGPILLTNTHSVGLARDASIKWQIQRAERTSKPFPLWSLPIVAETWDGFLNDINGFHVKENDVFAALDSAHGGPLDEGSVGGGTGMVCYGFKGGIGTSSRLIEIEGLPYAIGVLVQCNCGRRTQLTIAGIPVGREITGEIPYAQNAPWIGQDVGSIIIIVATDAPLLPHQLRRLTKRATMGLARTGSTSGNGSGDLFLAFSTANKLTAEKGVGDVKVLANDSMNPIFQATVEATEEAIVNAMIAGNTMVGVDDRKVIALPHDDLVDLLKKYNRVSR